MNRHLLLLLVLAVGIGIGLGVAGIRGTGPVGEQSRGARSTPQEPLYWVAPMDPNFRRDGPGKSPMGMELIPVFADEDAGIDGVRISPVVENNIGLRTEAARRERLAVEVATVGYVTFNEDRLSHLHPRVEGWIEKLYVASVGDRVGAGQVLFDLYAPALVNAQQEFLAALASGNKSLVEASRERLRLLGIGSREIEALAERRQVRDSLPFVSDRDAYVSALHARTGMYVKPADELMSLGDLGEVWVVAEVFERQLGLLQEGDLVTVTARAHPGRDWQGQVDYLYPVLDAASRTARIRIVLANEDEVLKPNLAVDLSIYAAPRDQVLTVPRQAVIRGGRGDRVVKQVAPNRYRSVAISAGIESGDRVEVLSGLQDGDVVVTSAQFLIDSESNIDAETQRMQDSESASGAEPRHDDHG